MGFDEIRQKAVSEWEIFHKSKKPLILVGAATCGRAAGASDVIDAIKKELKELLGKMGGLVATSAGQIQMAGAGNVNKLNKTCTRKVKKAMKVKNINFLKNKKKARRAVNKFIKELK